MNILSMLVRLESALGRSNLTKQMVLIPQKPSLQSNSSKELNFVVGYDGSPRSQTALDLTLWIAHQTRLATHKQVTVQVVYVVDLEVECGKTKSSRTSTRSLSMKGRHPEMEGYQAASHSRAGGAIAELPSPSDFAPKQQSCQISRFEQADRILWQARHMAEEWRGSLETHLRFGSVVKELRDVVKAESASLLVLGCESPEESLVQQLGNDFPCPVLGVPPAL